MASSDYLSCHECFDRIVYNPVDEEAEAVCIKCHEDLKARMRKIVKAKGCGCNAGGMCGCKYDPVKIEWVRA